MHVHDDVAIVAVVAVVAVVSAAIILATAADRQGRVRRILVAALVGLQRATGEFVAVAALACGGHVHRNRAGVALAGMAPSARISFEAPVSAVRAPPQVALALPTMTMPSGKRSTSGSVMWATSLLGLLRTMVSVETSPTWMLDGQNALSIVGALCFSLRTFRMATAGAALLPLSVWRAPAEFVVVAAFGDRRSR